MIVSINVWVNNVPHWLAGIYVYSTLFNWNQSEKYYPTDK